MTDLQIEFRSSEHAREIAQLLSITQYQALVAKMSALFVEFNQLLHTIQCFGKSQPKVQRLLNTAVKIQLHDECIAEFKRIHKFRE